jgi:hypothetical protein
VGHSACPRRRQHRDCHDSEVPLASSSLRALQCHTGVHRSTPAQAIAVQLAPLGALSSSLCLEYKHYQCQWGSLSFTVLETNLKGEGGGTWQRPHHHQGQTSGAVRLWLQAPWIESVAGQLVATEACDGAHICRMMAGLGPTSMWGGPGGVLVRGPSPMSGRLGLPRRRPLLSVNVKNLKGWRHCPPVQSLVVWRPTISVGTT